MAFPLSSRRKKYSFHYGRRSEKERHCLRSTYTQKHGKRHTERPTRLAPIPFFFRLLRGRHKIMRHLHVTRDGIVIRKVDSPSRHTSSDRGLSRCQRVRFVLWWRRQKGTFTGERAEGEGAPLINRRDAIRAAAAAAELLPFDLPPSYFFSLARLFGGRNER